MKRPPQLPEIGEDDETYEGCLAVFGMAEPRTGGREGFRLILTAVPLDGPVTARVIAKPKQ